MLNVSESRQDDVVILTVEGRLDQMGAPAIEKTGLTLIQGGVRRILLDMTGVEYISSAGLRTLLVMAKMMKGAQGRLLLCCLTPLVREVMEISGFDKVLTCVENRETALTALS
jgi:anti-anti-sigma factor